MTTLAIRLLGPLRVDIDGRPIGALRTNKVRALLAYLAIEAGQPIPREKLAGLLWPEFEEHRARANLSQALFTLRKSLGDHADNRPFLEADHIAINLVHDHRLWVDACDFSERVRSNRRASTRTMIAELEQAVSLYEDEFLASLSIQDSPAFELWCLTLREKFHRQMREALIHLVSCSERSGEYETALTYARRLVDHDSWREEAHAALMRLLALTGRRSEALEQYDRCCRILAENVGIAPTRQTKELYEAIRQERISSESWATARTQLATEVPAFITGESSRAPESMVCVGRASELQHLHERLATALEGEGYVTFISGEAGSGKTVLARTFGQQAIGQHRDLLVASGKGTAYTGSGDPYASFRTITAHLTGDIASEWAAGAVNRQQALRLWRAVPLTAEALVRDAPGLIGSFVDGKCLLERVVTFVQEAGLDHRQMRWLSELEELAEGSGDRYSGQNQAALFEQYLRFLNAITPQAPLLFTLDDLQWADAGTIDLLFHISRNLQGQRLLIVGAYRPEEVAFTPEGRRHPLSPVIYETQRAFGDVILELGRSDGQSFIDEIIDSEQNALESQFRTELFKLTGGHALYTTELLRGLKERGALYRAGDHGWVARSELDWEELPPRVEGVIAERIGRLPTESRQLLEAACIQGETFIAEVVAQVLGIDETRAISILSNELTRIHRLVRAQRLERATDTRDRESTYQFHHFLFQKYLHDQLDPIVSGMLHEATGRALEQRAGKDPSALSVQLARHFEIAGLVDEAVYYRLQAGNYAVRIAANEEAATHFTHGLELLAGLPATSERIEQELALQLGLGTALQMNDGYGSKGAQRAYGRAQELCGLVGESTQLVAALWPIATYSAMVGELDQALTLAQQAVSVADRAEDALMIAVAHHHLGWILYHHGRFTESVAHQQVVIDLYDRQYHEPMIQMFGHDFGVTSLGWSAWPLVFLGYVDRALQRCHEAIALAQALDHPFSLVHAFGMAAQVHALRGEPARSAEFGERMLELATAYGFNSYVATAHYPIGNGLVAKGQFSRGLAHWWKMLELLEMGGVKLYHRGGLGVIVGLLTHLGQLRGARDALARADAIGYQDQFDAMLENARGQLMAAEGCALEEVESCFLRGIRIARGQKAKWLELQVATSLARLWLTRGRMEEAGELLAPVVDWFTEGLETPIYQEAVALLSELS